MARYLDVPERTLRRAAAQGLIHGRRTGPRTFETSLREEAYLRRHWPLLSRLRAALRTEPNVRLAVLFGSQATGDANAASDVDIIVAFADPAASKVAATTARLERSVDRDVQIARLEDAERSPALMVDVLAVGRVLVDRDDLWPGLKSAEPAWRRRAEASAVSLEDALPDLDLPE